MALPEGGAAPVGRAGPAGERSFFRSAAADRAERRRIYLAATAVSMAVPWLRSDCAARLCCEANAWRGAGRARSPRRRAGDGFGHPGVIRRGAPLSLPAA